MRKGYGAICLALLVLIACGPADAYEDLRVEANEFGEPATFAGVEWLRHGEIVVGSFIDSIPIGADSLQAIEAATGAVAPLDLAERPACRITDYRRPTDVPDGCLGALRNCRPSTAGGDKLVAIDVASRHVDVLVDVPARVQVARLAVGGRMHPSRPLRWGHPCHTIRHPRSHWRYLGSVIARIGANGAVRGGRSWKFGSECSLRTGRVATARRSAARCRVILP